MFVYTIETIFSGFMIAVFIIIKLYLIISSSLKQRKCKHKNYRETMSCDAVCVDCSKNLGFIGAVRDREKRNEL